MTDIRSKDQPFYLPLSQHPPTPAFRNILENYSKITPSDLNSHLEVVRDDAWDHHPYPCIGLWFFMDLGVSSDDLIPHANPAVANIIKSSYGTILQKLKSGGKFLDVGCMFAQDTRKLVYDGVPAENVYGTDLHNEYFQYGYKLFKDENIIPMDHFIAADILDETDPGLKPLEGKIDVLNNGQFLHVFPLEEQKIVLKRFIKLLKPEKGVMVTGRCAGHEDAGSHVMGVAKATVKGGDATKIDEHNAESFKKLWVEVGEETGTSWDVNVWLLQFGLHTGGDDKPANWHRAKENGVLSFIVTRQ